MYEDLGELGLMGLYVPEQYGGAGLSQTGYARMFESIGQVDGSLTVALGVHQSIGMKGIVLFGSDEQKERFLPDLCSRAQARGLRADRAEGRLGRLQRAVARGQQRRRVVDAQRREALDRQRRAWLGVRRLRPHRGRRLRPPHRLHPREGDARLRGRRAVRHDGPARQQPLPAVLQGRPDPAGERARRARRGLPLRDADPQQRAHVAGDGRGRPRQEAARPDHRPRARRAASSTSRSATSTWSRTRSAGWSPTCSASSRCRT